MLEVKVKKEDLQAKIQEELSKLEAEWGDVLYKDTETVVVKRLESCENMRNEWFRNSHTYSNGLDLELEEFKYINATNVTYHKALLSAIKRKDKLLNLSGMFNLVSDNTNSINEGTYRFLYNEFDCKKPVYKPFKETKIYELLLKQVPEYSPPQGYDYDKVEPLPTRVVQERYQPNKQDLTSQEALWLSWLIAVIIAGVILLFVFK